MNLLDVFFILSGTMIFVFAFNIAKKQYFNLFHFLIFVGIGLGLLVFTFNPFTLQFVGAIFGLQRGADVLVYISVIFLLYFSLVLLKRIFYNSESITALLRSLCIENSRKKFVHGREVFLVRVYNEVGVVKSVLEKIFACGYKNILVVNDGSTDGTQDVLEEFGDKIILLNHYQNRGGGAALETGFEYLRRYADVEYVICFDADGQHDVGDLNLFFAAFEKDKDLDVVIGSRFIQKTTSNVPFLRRVVLFLGSIFTFFLSGISLTDSHNGYRVIKREALDKIRLTMDGMEYASELVECLYRHKLKFTEVPVNITYTGYSLQKGQKSINAINIGFKMIWHKFFK